MEQQSTMIDEAFDVRTWVGRANGYQPKFDTAAKVR